MSPVTGPYGNITDDTSPSSGDRFGFTGMTLLATIGLYFDHARDYDPFTTTFTTQDPYGFSAGDANLYRYVVNSPTNLVDPSGLWGEWLARQAAYVGAQASYAATKMDQAAGVAGTFVLTGAVVSMDSASGLELAGAAGNGLKTGGKAVVNGAASAAVSTATLGIIDKPMELIAVSEEDRANGYDTAVGFAKGGVEIGLSVVGPAAVTKLAKGTRYACTVGKGVAAFEAAGDAVGVGQGVADMRENGLTVGNALQVAGGGLGFAGSATAALKGKCFPAGTLVATVDGLLAIEHVREGERVWAYDLVAGIWRPCVVLQTFQDRYQGRSTFVTIAGETAETIEATLLHPFWVVRGQDLEDRPRRLHIEEPPTNAATPGRWVDAGDLQVGDELLLRDGRIVPVEAVRTEPYDADVYNFEVDELHCYAVGWHGVLVHNSCGDFDAPTGTLGDAEAARDALGQQLGRKSATYTGGVKDGRVAAGRSANPVGCAEDDVARQLGADAQFTKAMGWRRSPATGQREWVEIPVCTRCQGKYSPDQFPPDVKAEPGGPWGSE
jgi:RHS repeat-associated protein